MSRVILILLFLLVSGISHAQENNQPIRAAQVFHSNANNYREFEREVIRMKHLGVNIMIFRVFGNKGDRIYKFANPGSNIGVYFKTTHSPVIDDVLGKVTKIAHKHGIKVFAWMTTRHAIYGGEEDVWDSEYSFSQMDYKTLPKLDLFNDQVVWRLQQLYADLAKYLIDGVLIQDDFVMRHMEGFGTEARVQYLSQYNKLLDAKNMYTELELKDNGRVKRIVYSDEFWQFQGWKNAQLILVADELIKALKETNPRLEVALNVSYELFHKPKNALAWFAHDKILAKKFNYVAVMAYQDQIMKELEVSLDEAGDLIKENTDKAIEAMGSPKRVIMKIQTIDWDTSKELSLKQIRFIYQKVEFVSPDVGIALAPWENRNYNFMKVGK
jgi:biofilm PGA synthesis lipoprotein PgaB